MQRDGGPGGAGGAGNPTGGSFTGPAQALEIIGDFAYAFTGGISANTTTQTALEFQSGNFVFVGTFTYNGPVQEDNSGIGINSSSATIYFNDIIISIIKVQTAAEEGPAQGFQDLVIPPYTKVKVTFDSDDIVAERLSTGSLTGRIYRG